MKISKLDISDFRWFRGHNTFDFLTEGNVPARVIVIYAPNGSGKTSLTEAIEWAFQGAIERLNVLLNEYKGSKPREGHILKNRNSTALSGTVKVEISRADEKITLSRSTLPLGNRRHHDYVQTSAEVAPSTGINLSRININHYILSQTKINEFLLNASVGKLFQGFLSLGGRERDLEFYTQLRVRKKELLAKLDGVKSQQRENNNSQEASKKQREALQKELEGDLGVQELLFFNEIDALIDSNFFTPDQVEPAGKLRSVSVRLQWIHDNLSSLQGSLHRVLNDRTERTELLRARSRRQKAATGARQIQYLDARLSELSSEEKILLEFKEVSRSVPVISALGHLKIYQEDIRVLERKQSKLAMLISRHETQLGFLSEKYEQESSRAQQLERWFAESKVLIEEHNLNPFELNLAREECLALENTLNYKTLTATAVKSGRPELINPSVFAEYNLDALTLEIAELTKKFEADESILLNLRNALSTFESNSKILAEFKKQAVELSKDQSSCNCPACGTSFGDNSALLNAIATANLDLPTELRASLDTANENRSISFHKLEWKNLELAKKLIELGFAIDKGIAKDMELLQSNRARLKSAERLATEISALNLTEVYSGDTAEIYANFLENINAANTQLQISATKLQRIRRHLERLSRIGAVQNDIRDVATRSVDAAEVVLYLSEYYKKLEALREQFPKEVPDLAVRLTEVRSSIAAIKDELAASTRTLFIQAQLTSLDEVSELLTMEQRETERLQVLEEERAIVRRFLQNLQEKVPLAKLANLAVMKARVQAAIEKSVRLLRSNEANVVLESHLLNEKTLAELAVVLQKNLLVLTAQVRSVDLAIRSSQAFLVEIIKKTTNIDLLNDIYRLIDPNLSYRKISFEVDITKGKESLFIKSAERLNSSARFIDDPEEIGPAQISPALFFSEAQSNVLSICLFLTNIANAKRDGLDFLLMDDPIQSMDDINAYAFVDMCRLYSERFDKQIIITTHDSGFYNLFQQRFPSESSKFKYIELSESVHSY